MQRLENRVCAAHFKLHGSCITFNTVNNILTSLCHCEYSICPLLAQMHAWICLRHWSCNGLINNAACASPAHALIRRCLKYFTPCTCVW